MSNGFWHREGTDGFGNRIISGGTSDRHSVLEYSSKGVVEMDTYCIPDAMPSRVYSMHSALTAADEEMKAILPLMTGDVLTDCMNIAHAVHAHIDYVAGVSTVVTTAHETFIKRRGVCQDYAHLMIALCRSGGIPARYVCGLMEGEGATHAWVEVHDGLCWYAFDPTNDTAVATGYVKLAHGRDSLDCPVNRGVFYGSSVQSVLVSVRVGRID